jgi:ribose-phosphate pyrophosphokinase
VSLPTPDIAIHAFAEGAAPARALAERLGLPCFPVAARRFPDGESLVRIAAGGARAVLYRSLDDPNAKLVEVLFAAGALRDAGVGHITLVCPYLAYMRQDIAFNEGEAVSQRLVGQLLGRTFDRVVTVDPHLHRIGSLAEAIPLAPEDAVDLTAAPLLARALQGETGAGATVIVGPDSESRQWAARVAEPLGARLVVGRKERHGDRSVEVTLPPGIDLGGCRVVLVDDVVSSGHTLASAARAARAAGAGSVEALTVHALYGETVARLLAAAGVDRVRSCDSVPHPSNAIGLAPLLADALDGAP